MHCLSSASGDSPILLCPIHYLHLLVHHRVWAAKISLLSSTVGAWKESYVSGESGVSGGLSVPWDHPPHPTPNTIPHGARLTWGDGIDLVWVITTLGVVLQQHKHAGACQGTAEVGLPLGWVFRVLIPTTRLCPGLKGCGGGCVCPGGGAVTLAP